MRTLVALALVSSSACFPESLRTLKIPADKDITVPGTAGNITNPLAPDQVFPADAINQALSDSMAQSFSTEGVDKDAVDSLKLTALTATVTEPNEGNTQVRDLGFLTSATFFLGAEGQDEIKVAESEAGAFDTDPAPTTYDFPLTNAECAPLIKAADAVSMRADVVPDDYPNFQTTVSFHVELTVIVNPVGALNGNGG